VTTRPGTQRLDRRERELADGQRHRYDGSGFVSANAISFQPSAAGRPLGRVGDRVVRAGISIVICQGILSRARRSRVRLARVVRLELRVQVRLVRALHLVEADRAAVVLVRELEHERRASGRERPLRA
jgi:hypothetical protein